MFKCLEFYAQSGHPTLYPAFTTNISRSKPPLALLYIYAYNTLFAYISRCAVYLRRCIGYKGLDYFAL